MKQYPFRITSYNVCYTKLLRLQPFLTKAPAKIWEQLGITPGELTAWDSAKSFGLIPAGTTMGKGEPIFPRLEVEKEIEFIDNSMTGGTAAAEAASAASAPAVEQPELKEEIGIDDFAKVELRVAEVLACEPVPKADKLLKLQLDLGFEQRQVVSGIAKFYKPSYNFV